MGCRQLPLLYLHVATNPMVLFVLTHPSLPFVTLGGVHTRAQIQQVNPKSTPPFLLLQPAPRLEPADKENRGAFCRRTMCST